MSENNGRRIKNVRAVHHTERVKPVIHTILHSTNPPRVEVRATVSVPARVKETVSVPTTVQKKTFTRMNLGDGDFMMNYYFRRTKSGELVPEDIESATHFERVVYDRDGNIIGSTTGELNDVVKW